ncbi:SDR family NAD(P)-dependent oxidoreductase [Pacificibacter marinus]|uniref:SDR family NAD(P)-dependent oxidoreductase n=1 Tax=Pacificibacter marinus TaxID=658057 RepID=UPI001C07DBAE|nr:SDR family oxidoreductase [Pacificibacter marinus]MBU2867498.1 SDR family oxidoreductase [Pacificibacter marinus]
MSWFNGKVALVTGAAYGIGAASALALARQGCDVAIMDVSEDMLAETMAALAQTAGRHAAFALDLRQPDKLAPVFNDIVKAMGQVDILVNNAGIQGARKPAVDISPKDWSDAISINLNASFFMAARTGQHLIERGAEGAVVNVTSAHGLVGVTNASPYAVSKAGLIHATKCLAAEWAPHGIRVNAVAPGPTTTKTRVGAHNDPEKRKRVLSRVPMGRLGNAEDVAEAVCYLAGPHATFLTGQVLAIDGGVTTI